MNGAETMHVVSAAEIARLLPMPEAITVASKAFAAISGRVGQFPERIHLPLRDGDALVMPGYDGMNYLGTKIVAVRTPKDCEPGTQASYVLVDTRNMRPLLFCDGTALTALRTGAATAPLGVQTGGGRAIASRSRARSLSGDEWKEPRDDWLCQQLR